MVGGGEHKAHAHFAQAAFHHRRRQFNADAQGLQHIGAAAVAGGGAVAVLGHGEAGAGHYESGGGGNVKGAFAVAAGAAGINGDAGRGGNGQRLFPHHGGKAGDFRRGFALDGQGGEIGAQLGGGSRAVHNGAHHGDGIVHRQRAPGGGGGYSFSNHCGTITRTGSAAKGDGAD